MMPLTVQTICAAVGGTVLQSSGAALRDVTTDSRRVPQEALFIPLVGERFDGHAYIEKALEAGAAGCLTAKTPEALLPGKFYIQVPDTRLALKALAAWYRGQFRLPVVQVTGSVGKTTTKEMIAAVLTQKYETLRTEGNLNNDIGAPLTLLRLMPEHEAAVIETGMNHFGEIRYLGEMVRPDIAVITNVGDAHIENLGNTRQGILQAKCEIFENLTPEGVAVLNGDDELLNTVTLPQIILRCGEGEHCEVRVTDIDDRGLEGVACTVTTAKAAYRLETSAPGRHMVYPMAMAAAIGERLGLTAAEIVFLAFEGVELLVERLFLLLEAALLLLQVSAALLDFLFVFGSGFMNFLFRFHEHLALLILAALDGFVDDTRCFGFCASDLTLRDFLAIEHADQKEDKCYNQQSCDEQDVTIPFHCRNTPPVLQIGCVCHEKVMLPPATPMHRANKQIHCLLYRFTSRKSSNYAGKIVSLQENLCKAYKALTTCSRNDRIIMSWKRNSFSVFNLIDTRV